MLNVHDNIINSYKVDLENKVIVLHTKSVDGRLVNVVFTDVLAHVFRNHLYGSIILDIEEEDLGQFFGQNRGLLKEKKDYCWPIDYNDVKELEHKLEEEHYSYYIILASYGLNGWVLAKNVECQML
ncbi:hypothetical protein [Ornithinibacillus sp. 179-J 7C1 HS]|uniref:hypothetical protein n=1 Tax=Ornithinibacillus sp. 179-J 7C1 HS TaxID=3142384 RepID=UPI0039A0738C